METVTTPYTSILTIAGSDSGGCAGIQADIKSISACGAFAASVITATTAQNTQGVIDIHPIPIPHLEKQLDAVLSDINFSAVKIGMLHSCEVIETIKQKLSEYKVENIVIDPVMIASSGDALITHDAIECLKKLLPIARLITPNSKEAGTLVGHEVNRENAKETARKIGLSFETSVLLKGGHLESSNSDMLDILFEYPSKKMHEIQHPHVNTVNIHGTGCSLSSSIAAFLGQEYSLEQAVKKGCSFINKAIENGKGKRLGKGHGPINHFGLR